MQFRIKQWTKNNNTLCSREDTKASQSSTTPSAAAERGFNGTNRSDTVSHLMKLSHHGYGSSSG